MGVLYLCRSPHLKARLLQFAGDLPGRPYPGIYAATLEDFKTWAKQTAAGPANPGPFHFSNLYGNPYLLNEEVPNETIA